MTKTKAELVEENKRLKIDVKELIETVSINTKNLNFYAKERSDLKSLLEEVKIGLNEEETKTLIATLTATSSVLKTYSEELLKIVESLLRKIA